MNIIVTSGGTREAIDGVRFITNFSTGTTGAEIADVLAGHGHEVTYVHAVDAKLPIIPAITRRSFVSFQDIDRILQEELKSKNLVDAVIHLAAVSDYSVGKIFSGGDEFDPSETEKLDSSDDIQLLLTKNFKIVDRLKKYSVNPKLKVIAFKLTNTNSLEQQKSAALKLSLRPAVDYVVQDNLSEISSHSHVANIYRAEKMIQTCHSKAELGKTLELLLLGDAPTENSKRSEEAQP